MLAVRGGACLRLPAKGNEESAEGEALQGQHVCGSSSAERVILLNALFLSCALTGPQTRSLIPRGTRACREVKMEQNQELVTNIPVRQAPGSTQLLWGWIKYAWGQGAGRHLRKCTEAWALDEGRQTLSGGWRCPGAPWEKSEVAAAPRGGSRISTRKHGDFVIIQRRSLKCSYDGSCLSRICFQKGLWSPPRFLRLSLLNDQGFFFPFSFQYVIEGYFVKRSKNELPVK